MDNSVRQKIVLIGLTCVFFIGLVTAVLNATSYAKERDNYIEVGGGKIVYVPRTTTFVKVNGQVRRIVKFASSLSQEEIDCECPNCCKGSCYVIVFSDSILGGNPIVILTVIWVACT